MTVLGLLTTLVYVPGYTGAYIQTGWAMLSVVLSLALWRPATIGPLHWAGGLFLVYAFASLWWTPNRDDGILILWQLAILALAFRLGSTAPNLPFFWAGMALGLGVSSVISVLQFFRIEPVLQTTIERSSGLFYSPVVLGGVSALVLIALCAERMWWYTPWVIPSLLLSQSRGAWVACVVAGCAMWLRSFWVLVPLAVFGLLFILFPTGADSARLEVWRAVFQDLTFFGHGAGSLQNVSLVVDGQASRVVFAHNDFLHLLYQFGFAALILFWVILIPLMEQTHAREWPVLVAFLTMAVYAYPTHAPATAFIGALVAGRLAARWALARSVSVPSRSHELPRRSSQEPSMG